MFRQSVLVVTKFVKIWEKSHNKSEFLRSYIAIRLSMYVFPIKRGEGIIGHTSREECVHNNVYSDVESVEKF